MESLQGQPGPVTAVEPGSWEYQFRMLTIFLRTHGHCAVPYCARRDSLGHWLMQQHLAALAEKLDPEHRRRLEDLGVVFDRHDLVERDREQRWDQMLAVLAEFKRESGHCQVPSRRPEHRSLHGWLTRQRQLHRHGRLRADRRRQLAELGVDFESRRARTAPEHRRRAKWEESFRALAEFKREFGHCDVPWLRDEYKELYGWLARQRHQQRQKKLSADRLHRLVELGVTFSGGGGKAAWRHLPRAKWDTMFQALVAFRNQTGHCRVPTTGEHRALANWVYRQRHLRPRLDPEHLQRLSEIGFEWTVPAGRLRDSNASWERRLAELEAFKQRFGHCDVPQGWHENPGLSYWVVGRRLLGRRGLLPAHGRERLEKLGMSFELRTKHSGHPRPEALREWERRFAALENFRRQFGHFHVPSAWPECPGLAKWLYGQRAQVRRGRMARAKQARLESLGVVFEAYLNKPSVWEQRFQQLLAFKEQFGRDPGGRSASNPPGLCSWLAHQRFLARQGRLPSERRSRLESAGVAVDRAVSLAADEFWEQKFSTLAEYRQAHGDCQVPTQWPKDPHLANWVIRQRQLHRAGRLAPERAARLESLGFTWHVTGTRWEAMFATLQEFRQQHGHCLVPMTWNGSKTLSTWIVDQRYQKRRGLLPDDRIRRLEAIGFEWERPQRHAFAADRKWEEHFQELVRFQQQHGHCRVNSNQPETRRLGQWANRQRRLKKTGTLRPERVQRLDDLGFLWELADHESEATWERHFAELAAWREAHGHCQLRYSDPNQSLAYWCNRQRQRWRKGSLDPKRVRRLEQLGFLWDPRAAEWEQRWQELAEFRRLHEHGRVAEACFPRALSRWVQRQRLDRDRLTAEQVRRLDGLGFEWTDPPRVATPDANPPGESAAWRNPAPQLLGEQTLEKPDRGHPVSSPALVPIEDPGAKAP